MLFTCWLCSFTTDNSRDLSNHVRKHETEQDSSGPGPSRSVRTRPSTGPYDRLSSRNVTPQSSTSHTPLISQSVSRQTSVHVSRIPTPEPEDDTIIQDDEKSLSSNDAINMSLDLVDAKLTQTLHLSEQLSLFN